MFDLLKAKKIKKNRSNNSTKMYISNLNQLEDDIELRNRVSIDDVILNLTDNSKRSQEKLDEKKIGAKFLVDIDSLDLGINIRKSRMYQCSFVEGLNQFGSYVSGFYGNIIVGKNWVFLGDKNQDKNQNEVLQYAFRKQNDLIIGYLIKKSGRIYFNDLDSSCICVKSKVEIPKNYTFNNIKNEIIKDYLEKVDESFSLNFSYETPQKPLHFASNLLQGGFYLRRN